MLKVFKLKADCEFEAKNIDDAFRVLGKYFKEMSTKGTDAESPIIGGELHIEPLKSLEEQNALN